MIGLVLAVAVAHLSPVELKQAIDAQVQVRIYQIQKESTQSTDHYQECDLQTDAQQVALAFRKIATEGVLHHPFDYKLDNAERQWVMAQALDWDSEALNHKAGCGL